MRKGKLELFFFICFLKYHSGKTALCNTYKSIIKSNDRLQGIFYILFSFFPHYYYLFFDSEFQTDYIVENHKKGKEKNQRKAYNNNL